MPVVALQQQDSLELLRRDTTEYIQEVGDFSAWVAAHHCRKITHGRIMQYLRLHAKTQITSIVVTKPEHIDIGRQDLSINARYTQGASGLYARWDALANRWEGGRVAFDLLDWQEA